MRNDVLSALARRAKSGYVRTQKGRSGWLAGTFELAAALSKARKKLPSDQEFHDWISKAGLASISKDDRAALICIGNNPKAAREYFASNGEFWSWRMCAQQVRFGLALPVSQPAKPMSVSVVADRVAEEPKPVHVRLISNERQRDRDQLPEPMNMSTVRIAKAWVAVNGVIEASSLSTDSVARYYKAARPSPDQVREAAQWLELLADALETTQDQHRYTTH